MDVDAPQPTRYSPFIHFFDTTPTSFPWSPPLPDQIRLRRALMDDLLIFDILLSSGSVGDPYVLYPPTSPASLQTLLDKIEGSNYDSLKKDCLVYFLLKWYQDGRERRFSEGRCLPPQFVALADAYWGLDAGVDLPRAISLLSDPRLNRDHSSKIIRTISLSDPSESAPLIRRYIQTAKPPLIEPPDIDTYALALAECSLLDAWQFSRTFPEDDKEGAERERVLRKLLEWCVMPQLKPTALKQLLHLPLSPYEERILISFSCPSLLPSSSSSTSTQPQPQIPFPHLSTLQTLLITRLLLSGRHVEAISLDTQFYNATPQKYADVGDVGERRKMVRDVYEALGSVERGLVDLELGVEGMSVVDEATKTATTNAKAANVSNGVADVPVQVAAPTRTGPGPVQHTPARPLSQTAHSGPIRTPFHPSTQMQTPSRTPLHAQTQTQGWKATPSTASVKDLSKSWEEIYVPDTSSLISTSVSKGTPLRQVHQVSQGQGGLGVQGTIPRFPKFVGGFGSPSSPAPLSGVAGSRANRAAAPILPINLGNGLANGKTPRKSLPLAQSLLGSTSAASGAKARSSLVGLGGLGGTGVGGFGNSTPKQGQGQGQRMSFGTPMNASAFGLSTNIGNASGVGSPLSGMKLPSASLAGSRVGHGGHGASGTPGRGGLGLGQSTPQKFVSASQQSNAFYQPPPLSQTKGAMDQGTKKTNGVKRAFDHDHEAEDVDVDVDDSRDVDMSMTRDEGGEGRDDEDVEDIHIEVDSEAGVNDGEDGGRDMSRGGRRGRGGRLREEAMEEDHHENRAEDNVDGEPEDEDAGFQFSVFSGKNTSAVSSNGAMSGGRAAPSKAKKGRSSTGGGKSTKASRKRGVPGAFGDHDHEHEHNEEGDSRDLEAEEEPEEEPEPERISTRTRRSTRTRTSTQMGISTLSAGSASAIYAHPVSVGAGGGSKPAKRARKSKDVDSTSVASASASATSRKPISRSIPGGLFDEDDGDGDGEDASVNGSVNGSVAHSYFDGDEDGEEGDDVAPLPKKTRRMTRTKSGASAGSTTGMGRGKEAKTKADVPAKAKRGRTSTSAESVLDEMGTRRTRRSTRLGAGGGSEEIEAAPVSKGRKSTKGVAKKTRR